MQMGLKQVMKIVADRASKLKMISLQIEGEWRGLNKMIKTGANQEHHKTISLNAQK